LVKAPQNDDGVLYGEFSGQIRSAKTLAFSNLSSKKDPNQFVVFVCQPTAEH